MDYQDSQVVLWKVDLMKRTRSGVTIAINIATYGKLVRVFLGTQIKATEDELEAMGDTMEAAKFHMLIALKL